MANGGGSASLKNIILVGPGGSLGSVLLNGLLSEPRLTVSVLVRMSSSSLKSLPGGISQVFTVPDDYPKDQLVTAFAQQDAVVSAITSTHTEEQFRFIDAAVEAGIKRYVPSEYGLNNARPEARALNAVFDGKGAVQDYLRSKEETGLTWHAIGCGMWIDWSLQHDFLGLNFRNRTMTFWDDGNGKFSTSTLSNTALALNRTLLSPAISKNQVVYISDFATSQRELLDAIERAGGEKWTVKSVVSKDVIADNQQKHAAGDRSAVYALIETGFVTGQYGSWLEEKERIWNAELGLPRENLDDVVAKALRSVQTQTQV